MFGFGLFWQFLAFLGARGGVRQVWPVCSPAFPSSAFILLAGLKPIMLPKQVVRELQTQHICLGPGGVGGGRAYQPSTSHYQHLVSTLILVILLPNYHWFRVFNPVKLLRRINCVCASLPRTPASRGCRLCTWTGTLSTSPCGKGLCTPSSCPIWLICEYFHLKSFMSDVP